MEKLERERQAWEANERAWARAVTEGDGLTQGWD